MNIRENLEEVERRITAAAERSGRKRSDITLIAVTKTHPAEMMNEAIELGVTDIGENKPQEVRDKYADVKPVRWHLIGHLQTNKVKYVIDKVCLIHSVDSVKLMDEIERQAEKHDITMDILIQVNISGEETKSGIKPEEIYDLIEHAGELSRVKVKGLMTIAPKTDNPVTNALHFDNIHRLFLDIQQKKYDNISMEYLSMGMSGDYETAIEHGANMVRVGSAIFGQRDYSTK
ncbi:MAG: YggS family pyridoxal phosphate-dependent enzyme [Clostridia bacterium]|nr:YggS family pyridoxal phosphate-dependent enzyme [Clostridia bacterium]MBQ6559054.1 YggS family pyridoxal phosphate-dependent enzyme [Clostridia bacterium]MBR0470376.1 YggS family pyridoxal phosphate-dependent enzyme [Clostridia bacterium]